MAQSGVERADVAREQERLRLKRTRLLKRHREGYLDDEALQAELASVEVALGKFSLPTSEGFSLETILEAGERLPGIAGLWEVATPEERREIVTLLLEEGGLYYDLERKMIAAIKPRSPWISALRLASGVVELPEAPGMLFTEQWHLAKQTSE
jgi:hypothetical protein